MSPILVRPVREQLEHDRLIRLLQTKFRRKYDAGINPGNEQAVPVGAGPQALFPDLALFSLERGRRLQVVVEVETGESVNHLEALAEWSHLANLRAAFHLYVPSGMVDVARRLCEDNHIHVNEIWSYHTIGDEVRFALVHRSRAEIASTRARAGAPERNPAPAKKAAPPKKSARPTPAKAVGPASAKVSAGKKAKAVKPARPASAKASAGKGKPAKKAAAKKRR